MKNELEKHIRSNVDALDKKQPDPLILDEILRQMQESKNKQRGILISFRSLRWAAACAAIIIVCIAVVRFRRQPAAIEIVQKEKVRPDQEKPQTEVSLQSPGIHSLQEEPRAQASVSAANTKDKKFAAFVSSYKTASAAGRITAVSYAAALKNTDNDVVNALLHILNNDPNTNVRLAAVDGLAGFYKEPYTRKKMLASLKRQTDPIVQINLIGLLSSMRESGLLMELERMVKDNKTEKPVKDCAYSNILQLHS